MTIPMAELEIDDVAFLTGEPNGHDKQTSCRGICGASSRHSNKSRNWFLSCSQTQVFIMAAILISIIITAALIIALVHPFSDACFASKFVNESDFSKSASGEDQLLATDGQLFPWTNIRLPPFIKPFRYDLFMQPNLTTFYNKGTVEILLGVTERSDFLVIHAKKLNVTQIVMTDAKNNNIAILKHLHNINHEQLFIQFDSYLVANHVNYTLKIFFERQLEEQLEGFYVSSYTEASTDRKRYLLTTHFEPTAARSAFPCFDEPALKASFVMNMVHDASHKVYFNSDERSSIPFDQNGLVMSVFEETVPMSTYLVAFIVCDFKPISRRTKEHVNVRALVPSEQFSQAEFALRSAADILSYFQGFFNVTYPLTKLDLVAIPDFGAGAMENWGLITFRTTMILYNPEESSSEAQEQVAVVVSHELAHQWFGNLVTMEWWNDLWLNEGFASYVENLGVNYIQPEWKMLDQFVVSTTQHALSLDSLRSSHPIMANVKNPSEIEAIFDAISYKKGASLIRMLENFLSEEKLKLGLSHYLNKYQYKNAVTSDLWKSFTEVLHSDTINVSTIMDTWVNQKGYPVITVRWDGYQIHLHQQRFLSSPQETDAAQPNDISPYDYKWIIPVTIITNKNPGSPTLVWLNSTDMSLVLDSSINWFKLNVNQTGFYRVNYDALTWMSLIDHLVSRDYNHHILSPTDRSNLIDDAFALMRIGQLRVDLAMNLTRYLEVGEREYVPWETAFLQFAILDTLMLQHPFLHRYVQKLIEPLITIYGWADNEREKLLRRKLRSLALNAAVNYGDKKSIQIAKRYFQEWMNNNTKVAANLREVVYNTGVRFGELKEWEFCWKKYQKSSIPSEQKLLLGALGATRNAWLLNQYLNYSLDKNKIKTQDTVHVITVVSRNPLGKELAWKFVRKNWDQIINLFGQGSFSMDTIISETTWHFSSQFEYNQVDSFFKSVKVGSGQQAVEQSLEKIRANIFWKNNIENTVIQWLSRFSD